MSVLSVARYAPRLKSLFWIARTKVAEAGSIGRAYAASSPRWEFSSSTVPYDSSLTDDLLTRLPPTSEVCPASPVRV